MSKGTQRANKRATGSDARTQAQRFEDAARELGADEDEATFKAKLAVIGRQKPKDVPGRGMRKAVVAAAALTLIVLSVFSGNNQAAACPADLRSRAELLRSEIRKSYSARSKEAYNSGLNGLDIANSVGDTLPSGMLFDDAEQLLRCAGFSVHPRPGLNARGSAVDRYDVYADTRTLLPSGPLESTLVIVLLRPRLPDDYGRVQRVQVIIQITSL